MGWGNTDTTQQSRTCQDCLILWMQPIKEHINFAGNVSMTCSLRQQVANTMNIPSEKENWSWSFTMLISVQRSIYAIYRLGKHLKTSRTVYGEDEWN